MSSERIRAVWRAIEHYRTTPGRLALHITGTPEQDFTSLHSAIEDELLSRPEEQTAQPVEQPERVIKKLHLADGVKTDMLRIIDALYELKFFRDGSGLVLTQEKVFAAFGELFEDDFRNYSQSLSQSYDTTSDTTNTAIFDKMKGKTLEKMSQRQERAKKK